MWRGSDREEDGIDRGGRGPVGPLLHEFSSGAFEGLIVVSCQPCLAEIVSGPGRLEGGSEARALRSGVENVRCPAEC